MWWQKLKIDIPVTFNDLQCHSLPIRPNHWDSLQSCGTWPLVCLEGHQLLEGAQGINPWSCKLFWPVGPFLGLVMGWTNICSCNSSCVQKIYRIKDVFHNLVICIILIIWSASFWDTLIISVISAFFYIFFVPYLFINCLHLLAADRTAPASSPELNRSPCTPKIKRWWVLTWQCVKITKCQAENSMN